MLTPPLIDPLDARILLALDEDPSATALSLSRSLGVARNTIHARLRKLESSDGALGDTSRRVQLAALGYTLTAFVEISITQGLAEEAHLALEAIPEIVEIHSTTGDADLLVKVVARAPSDLHRVTNAVLASPGVVRTSTSVSLREVIPFRLSPLLRRTAGLAARSE